jgi:hypothetical protein
MSMSVSIHRPVAVVAKKSGTANWVAFYDSDGSRVDVFCENFEVAKATADAFNDAMAYSGADHEPA